MLNYAKSRKGGVYMNKRVNFSVGAVEFAHSAFESLSEKSDGNHMHDSYEILYIAKGKGRCLIEGAELEIKPGMLFFVKPFKYHSLELSSDSPSERYVVKFNLASVVKDALPAFERLIDRSELDSGRLFSYGPVPASIVSALDKFEMAQSVPEKERPIYVKLILSELLLLLGAEEGAKITQTKDELGARVIKYINECLDKDVSLDTIAKRFFVSKYYLCRSFKRYSGVSVHSYINHKRIMYAKQLIEAGETAASAAYKVGFGDYSAFYRTHLRILGVPPSQQSKKKNS